MMMSSTRRVFAVVLVALLLFGGSAMARKKKDNKNKGFRITDEINLSCTSVKDQNRAGTCWSYSGLGFFEAELLRMGKGKHDLSEMFVVRYTWHDKALRYVRMHGHMNFAAGAGFRDVVAILREYGIVPEQDYPGLNYGEENHVHGELDNVLTGYVNAVLKNGNRRLSTAWIHGFDGILNAYFGVVPKTVDGGLTPKQYFESLGIDLNDYVAVTSFMHHPFYSQFILEIPDNWRQQKDYNVPLDDMMAIINNALENGYTVAWGADVSDKGFLYKQHGVAIMPVQVGEEVAGAEHLRWTKMTEEERKKMLQNIEGPVPERQVTQEMRQKAFDNWTTTDDHGMLIVGRATDQNGTVYYKVKNSWTTSGVYNGFFYASEAYVKMQTTDIMVNKNSIPDSIAQKMGLK